jgi:parallel beta-helix repeat protein
MARSFRRVGILVLAAAAVAAVLLFAVFRVAGPRHWPKDSIFVPRDAATIRQALETASPGATIVLQVRAESFRGPVRIDTANVTLAAAHDGVDLVASGPDPALTIGADGVVVRGLEIASESIGIRIESARCRIEKTRVRGATIGLQLLNARGCEIRGIEVYGGRIGLELVSSGGNVLTDILVRDSSEFGLKALGSWDNVFEAIDVFGAPIGLSLEQGSYENELHQCRIERASIVGIEFRGSTDNLLWDSVVRDSRIGVAFEGVTGNEILGCEIDEVVVAGFLFQQAVRNRATENVIAVSQDAGIVLSQSAENTLAYNRIEECAGTGIRLDGSDRNLVIGNSLESVPLGIECDRSSYGRILRNAIALTDPSGTGLRFVGGAENRLLDNRVHGGGSGFVLLGSRGNSVLRNRMEGQAVVGLSLLDGSDASSVAENRIVGSLVGIVIVDSGRGELLSNHVAGNDTGLLLVQPGPGTRIEGNTIEGNRIGIRQADEVDVIGIERSLDGAGETASPVIVNNVFVRNESLDLSNETSIPVFAGGNWWGGVAGGRDTALAEVSDGVSLEVSAWKGALAIGTEADVSQEILGRILQYALTEAGFRVIDLIGMGDSDRVREALRLQDVDCIWWGTSEMLLTQGIVDEGELDVVQIPAVRRWTLVVSEATAQSLTEQTLSALADWMRESGGTFRYAVPQGLGEVASAAFEEVYGLRELIESVSRAGTLAEAEALLKFGAVEAAIVDSLEETLTFSGFVALEDDLAAFEPVGILVAFRRSLLERFSEVEDVLVDLAASLTTSVIHDLISRVRLLQREPETVALEYLAQQAILEEQEKEI